MRVLATFLTIILVAPALFLVAPQRTQANLVVYDPANFVENSISAIKSTISTALDITNTAATVAMEINALILQPLAFVLSGNLMKALTAGVIAFVIGKANGTGVPQFATDVMLSLQTAADSQALAYINQFGRNSNSPFAYSISSALRTNYLQKTTLAGFWAANMNTLARSSPSYAPGFLSGNWSQGGVAAWFALTTQTQNNPYTFYQASQGQMQNLIGPGVGGATGSRLAQLGFGQGFLSWCGAREEVNTTDEGDGTGMEGGVNPGDTCYNKDGTPGTIKTPGSVIGATLNKVLGGQQDQIVRMGNVGPQINQILGNIATVLQTVNFASQILGGSNSGGLFGVGQTSVANPTSRLAQFQNTPGALGVTNTSVLQTAATLPVTGPDMLNRATQYEGAWNTIRASANTASTTVASLINFCTSELNNNPNNKTQIDAARSALTTQIAPVFAQADTASSTVAAARALVAKIQSEANSSTDSAVAAYSADVATLQSMSPSSSDVINIQQEIKTTGQASASGGGLVVSGGTIIDRMNLIRTNAEALKTSVCTAQPSSN